MVICNEGVYGWGQNDSNQLGIENRIFTHVPMKVTFPAVPIQTAQGFSHSLFLLPDHSLYACGWNQYGQLGTGEIKPQKVPVQIKAIPGEILQVKCGEEHSVALLQTALCTPGGATTTAN
uniref:Uncharacterized protein n=1 Tax=Arcella intermedia TaxID=1963864 RepID=A0A6B2LSL6_9EUKA